MVKHGWRRFPWAVCALVVLAAAAFVFASPSVYGQTSEDCLRCHALPGLKKPNGESVAIDSAAFAASAHAKIGCTGCHQGDWSYPHEHRRKAVQCGECHQASYKRYVSGIHGREALKGNPDAPTCVTCHGIHDVVPMAELAKRRKAMETLLLEKCVDCHANKQLMQKYGLPLDRYVTYETSAHGRADRFGSLAVARCATCHGACAILPPSDPESPVNPKNLVKTCGRCHERPERFASLRFHVVSAAAQTGTVYTKILRGVVSLLIAFGAVGAVVFAIVAIRQE